MFRLGRDGNSTPFAQVVRTGPFGCAPLHNDQPVPDRHFASHRSGARPALREPPSARRERRFLGLPARRVAEETIRKVYSIGL
jgi:hypothetical protein